VKLRISFLLIGCVLVALTGCKEKGPQFNPYLTGSDLPGGYGNMAEFTKLQPTNQVNPEQLQPATDFFRLGPGDIIDVEVIGEPNSATTVFVGPDPG